MASGLIHPAVAPLSRLLGTWRGKGEGGFPTIASFKYGEEIHFSHAGNKPVIAYSQKTWKLDSGEAMHSESGYWRMKLDGSIEIVIAQSTGVVEVLKGKYNEQEKVVKVRTELVANASKVREIIRSFEIGEDEICYKVEMATVLTSLQTHLTASLKKL